MKAFIWRIVQAKSPFYAVLLTIASQAFILILNFASSVITARLLGPEGRGIFAAATIWPQFLSGFAFLGVPATTIFYLRRDPDAHREIIGAAYIIALVTSAISTAAGLVLALVTIPHSSQELLLLGEFCILFTFTYVGTEITRAILSAYGLFRALAVSNYIPPLTYVLGLSTMAVALEISPSTAAICLMFSGLLGAVWTFHRVSRVVRPGFHGGLRWLRPIACYALKLAPGSVSLKLMTSVDRLVLIPYIPAGELGLYSVAYSLSRLVFVLQTAVSTVLYPRLAGRPAVEISQLYSFSFRFVFYGVAATAILLAALAHYLLRMLYGPDFAKADILLIVLAIEAGVNALGELVIQLHVAAGQPSFASNTQIFTVVTATSLLLVLVPYYGAAGAAASLLIAAVLRLTVLLSGMRMRLHMPLPGLLPRVRDVLYVRERLL